ncbi:MAG: cell division protein FtsH, partial [Planctomycetales bacterium]
MDWLYVVLLIVGFSAGFLFRVYYVRGRYKNAITPLVVTHFHPVSTDDVTIAERTFPARVRADLQQAMDGLFGEDSSVLYFCGIRREYAHEGITFTDLLVESHSPAISVPPQYDEMDVGEDEPLRCLKNGLWLLEKDGQRYAVLLASAMQHGTATGVLFQIAVANDPRGTRLSQRFFKHLEESVARSSTYRGKILSLEQAEHYYSGESAGVTVHKLRSVAREQVILPKKTLDLLDRNVIEFVRQREKLAEFGQPTKKGILFYGPPGTGKTHTIHYLADAL